MTQLIPAGKTRLLLVEGRDDKEFFIQLGAHLGFDDTTPIHILEYGGRDGLALRLFQLTQLQAFASVSVIGVVRDADYKTDALQSIQDAIRTCNRNGPIELSIPQSALEPTRGQPAMSALLLPSTGREGMLEDMVLDALSDDPVFACVDEFFECLQRSDISVAKHRLPKAKARVFISGKNAAVSAAGDDINRQYLSDIYRMSWWKPELWDHPAFNDAKAFLAQLLKP